MSVKKKFVELSRSTWITTFFVFRRMLLCNVHFSSLSLNVVSQREVAEFSLLDYFVMMKVECQKLFVITHVTMMWFSRAAVDAPALGRRSNWCARAASFCSLFWIPIIPCRKTDFVSYSLIKKFKFVPSILMQKYVKTRGIYIALGLLLMHSWSAMKYFPCMSSSN